MTEIAALLAAKVRDVPDYPLPGVLFKDIAPLLADAAAMRSTVDALAALGRDAAGTAVDAVVGIEARGFILAAPVAYALGAGFVPVRKQGKLPGPTLAASYALEYGTATLEVQRDAFTPGARVLLIDDVLATGGTAAAAANLVAQAGGSIVGIAVLLEIVALGGRARLPGVPLHTLATC